MPVLRADSGMKRIKDKFRNKKDKRYKFGRINVNSQNFPPVRLNGLKAILNTPKFAKPPASRVNDLLRKSFCLFRGSLLIQSDILITLNHIKISLWMATLQVEKIITICVNAVHDY